MKTKTQTHTPGPWTFEHSMEEDGYVVFPEKEIDPSGRPIALLTGFKNGEDARLIAAAPDLLRALRFQASWTMRDGTPCACPAGKNEDEPKGKMPTVGKVLRERTRDDAAAVVERRLEAKRKRDEAEERRLERLVMERWVGKETEEEQ